MTTRQTQAIMRKSLITVGLAAAGLAAIAGLTACGTAAAATSGHPASPSAATAPAAPAAASTAARILAARYFTLAQEIPAGKPAPGIISEATGTNGNAVELMLVFPTPAAARAYAASIQWQLNANPAMVLMVNEDAAGSYGTVGLRGASLPTRRSLTR